MSEQTVHPSSDRLSAFSAGRMLRQDAASIESHIADCRECCETLLRLSNDDTFVDSLHEAGAGLDGSLTNVEIPESLAKHERYEVVEHIGRGGMGDVYKARHRLMDRFVAIKVINRRFVGDSEAVDRFRREVKAAARLSHPNIVASHDADRAGELHFLVMEYVDGVNLAELVQERGPLPVDEACRYVRQAARGLQYAHDRGMVHRDIKPHNLMLTEDSTVKILDFGLATLAPPSNDLADGARSGSALTAEGAVFGTPDYISPEQAADAGSADARSDVYSLGGTLNFLLTGRPPFPRGTVERKPDAREESAHQSIEAIRSGVPRALTDVIDRMLAPNPDDRPQTAHDVAAALERFTSAGQEKRRSPAGKVLVGLALVAAIVLAGSVYVMIDKSTRRTVDRDHRQPTESEGNTEQLNRKRDTLAAIAKINELGGSMRFDKNDPSLVTVSFNGERYDDSHLVLLRRLDKLETLYLPNTNVTDAGLRDHVRHLTTLRNLYVPNTDVTDAGLKHVAELAELRVLYIDGLPITDEGLAPLRNLKKLVGLSLERTSVTDAGLKEHVSRMPSLKMLFLEGTAITDEGLAGLQELKHLFHLDLTGTRVTDEGVRRFRDAFPDCKVVR